MYSVSMAGLSGDVLRNPAGAVTVSVPISAGALAERASGGDSDAFEELVKAYQRRVYGFAYQYVRDAEEARDVAQEIFVQLYRNLDRYDAERAFDPWFWRLATNVCLNYRRRRVPEPRDDIDPGGLSDPTAMAGESDLSQALGELDPGYRLPLLLHYHLDQSIESVAHSMGLSTAAVKSRMHRARGILRRSLAERSQ